MVKFCPECGNLFSHKINTDSEDEKDLDKLNYICLTCGFTEKVIDQCIIINELNSKVQDYPLNANMIYDHTLPRTKQIPCPNKDSKDNPCPYVPENEQDNAEIIMFQYNPTMLKTGYMCTSCNVHWKN